MELTSEQMTRLRQNELSIFKCFIGVCEQLNLTYFVIQGTLLGAVRHKGFIPWDDDIDVGMPRKDYMAFLEKGQALMPDNYFIQCHDTDPSYPHGFAKIRNSKTSFVETTCKNIPMNHGIYVDVFPYDYYPDCIISQLRFEIEKLLLRYRIRSVLYIPSDNEKSVKNFFRHVLIVISKFVYPDANEAIEKQNDLYEKFKKGKRVINNGSPWGKRECIPCSWIENVTTLDFEGILVNAPICYKEYLSHVYGNYMELPPMEKRISHHYICALSFTEEYKPESNILERKN